MRDDVADTPIPGAPTASDAAASHDAAPSGDVARLTDDIVMALKTVYDPEIPADVYELGLIYRIDIADDRSVNVDMTLTTPNCPSGRWPSRWYGIRPGSRAGCPTRRGWC